MRGAHSDVWCSKGTPLIEAELFAAERRRPAPNGRALLCAASYARKIQGITATHKLPDARNRAPVTPVSLHISDVSAQRKVRGVKRGQETILGVLSPFALRRGYGNSAGRPRQFLHRRGGAKGDGIDSLFSCPITSSRLFSASSHFSQIYASGLRILTVLHDFLKNFYCKSRKHFGQLETHLCENYNSKHRDQPGTAGASGWIE